MMIFAALFEVRHQSNAYTGIYCIFYGYSMLIPWPVIKNSHEGGRFLFCFCRLRGCISPMVNAADWNAMLSWGVLLFYLQKVTVHADTFFPTYRWTEPRVYLDCSILRCCIHEHICEKKIMCKENVITNRKSIPAR